MGFTINKQKHSHPALSLSKTAADSDIFHIPLSKPVPKISLSLTANEAAITAPTNPQPITATTKPNPKTFKQFLWPNPTISSLLASRALH